MARTGREQRGEASRDVRSELSGLGLRQRERGAGERGACSAAAAGAVCNPAAWLVGPEIDLRRPQTGNRHKKPEHRNRRIKTKEENQQQNVSAHCVYT